MLKTYEVLAIDSFSDETRGVTNDFIDEYLTPEEYIDGYLEQIEELPKAYKDLIPKWHDQPYYVELWGEECNGWNICIHIEGPRR